MTLCTVLQLIARKSAAVSSRSSIDASSMTYVVTFSSRCPPVGRKVKFGLATPLCEKRMNSPCIFTRLLTYTIRCFPCGARSRKVASVPCALSMAFKIERIMVVLPVRPHRTQPKQAYRKSFHKRQLEPESPFRIPRDFLGQSALGSKRNLCQ